MSQISEHLESVEPPGGHRDQLQTLENPVHPLPGQPGIPSNLKVKLSTYQMDRTNKDGNLRPLILTLTYLLNHLLSPTHLIFSFQTKTHLNLLLILSIPRLQPNLKEAPEYATHPKDFSTPIWAIPS
uniref:Uncharacterized protein n=1 Tax=Knipowitschia caucasica TaxID=637954 RepID=A0AAV2LER2_KNICA